MKFINYILLAATICYAGTTGVLAAPISTSQLASREADTSLDAREFLLSSREPLSPRVYDEVLGARTTNAQTMGTREYHLYPREPRRRAGGTRMSRTEKQDQDKKALQKLSGPPPRKNGLTRAEKQDRDKAAAAHHQASWSTPTTSMSGGPQAEHHLEHPNHVPEMVHQPSPASTKPSPSSSSGGFFSKVQNHWLVGKAKSFFPIGRSKTS